MTNNKTISTHSMLERMIYINKKINNGFYPNTKKLAADLEVSVATISRDIEFLRDRLQAPIQYSPAHHGYFYTSHFNLVESL